MRSLYKQNLLKSGWVMVDPEQVRVIDSNRPIKEKKSAPVFAEPEGDAVPYQAPAFDETDAGEATVDMLFSEGIDAEVVQAEQVTVGNERIEDAQRQAEEILAQAHAQAQEIVEQARIMSEQDARSAYENAKAQGMQDGYQQGIQKANAEAEAVRKEYQMKEQELLQQYEQKLEEMEPHLIQELTGVYEHVFAVELSQYRGILQHLISNTLRSVEMSDNYLIHVSEQDYSYISMQKAQIIEDGCVKNASVEIVEDRTLSKNECMIETADGIFDCSLSVQLTELKRKLQLLSYTGKKE